MSQWWHQPLRVRLKAEFQASNADLYEKTELSLPASAR